MDGIPAEVAERVVHPAEVPLETEARDCEAGGLEWLEANDADQSVFALARVASPRDPGVVIALNFTPVVRYGYRVGVEAPGRWREILNTDAVEHAGSGVGNLGGVESSPEPWHGRGCSLALTLPPLAGVFLRSPASCPV